LQRELELLYNAKEKKRTEKGYSEQPYSRTNKNSLQFVENSLGSYLKLVPDHMWSYNQHNARNIIRANWRFMKTFMARETGVS
jgi:hypothetical protein